MGLVGFILFFFLPPPLVGEKVLQEVQTWFYSRVRFGLTFRNGLSWKVLFLSQTGHPRKDFFFFKSPNSSSFQTLVLFLQTTWHKSLHSEVWCLKPDVEVRFLLDHFTLPYTFIILPSLFTKWLGTPLHWCSLAFFKFILTANSKNQTLVNTHGK